MKVHKENKSTRFKTSKSRKKMNVEDTTLGGELFQSLKIKYDLIYVLARKTVIKMKYWNHRTGTKKDISFTKVL